MGDYCHPSRLLTRHIFFGDMGHPFFRQGMIFDSASIHNQTQYRIRTSETLPNTRQTRWKPTSWLWQCHKNDMGFWPLKPESLNEANVHVAVITWRIYEHTWWYLWYWHNNVPMSYHKQRGALMIRNSPWNFLCRFCVHLSMHSNSTITRSFYWRYAKTIGRYIACWLQLEGQLGSLYTQSKAYNQPALNMCNIVWLQTKSHDDVIKWKHFPRYWPFVRGINRSPGNSPHKGLCRGALMFPLICA